MKKVPVLLAVILLAVMLPMLTLPAAAAREPVEYLFYGPNLNGSGYHCCGGICSDYEVIDSSHKPTDWEEGWYVVRGKVTIDDRVEVDGDVRLILADDCVLTCKKGIEVETATLIGSDASLTIYAESDGENMGRLIVNAPDKCAGIGSGNTWVDTYACGDITIHGGYIAAYGGKEGAGIGGGSGSNGGRVSIYGGSVHAFGGDDGAGIGGGNGLIIGGNGGEVTVWGGDIEAIGGSNAAAIGGGSFGRGAKVKLYGGHFDIETRPTRNPAIGGGFDAEDHGTIEVGPELLIIDESFFGRQMNPGFDPKPWAEAFASRAGIEMIVCRSMGPVTYRAYSPRTGTYETKECKDYAFVTKYIDHWTDGWYAVNDSGIFTDPVTVTGNVNLIIEDGKTLTALSGIRVEEGASLSVYAQSEGEDQGKLIVLSPIGTAGIGGGKGKNSGAFIVHGGEISVSGGEGAAAIGGGQNGAGGTFTIYGGNVTAEAGARADRAIGAGIGSSANGSIAVRGGYELLDLDTEQHIVKAAGQSWAQTLNGAKVHITVTLPVIPLQDPIPYRYYDENMVLTDAECTEYQKLDADSRVLFSGWYVANGSLDLPFLTVNGDAYLILTDGCELTVRQGFHVNEGNSLTIFDQADPDGQSNARGKLVSVISGPTSSEKRTYRAAGIGGDRGQNCGSVIIHGGSIVAEGGFNAAGIGGGENGNGGSVTIYGGDITARGCSNSEAGAGIGGGGKAGSGNITVYGGNITATGADQGTGIGTGSSGSGGSVTINGGTVNATGGFGGAGIGVGTHGSDLNITVSGGTVTAIGGAEAAGIGANCYSPDGSDVNVTVDGGTVTAIGGDACDAFMAKTVTVVPEKDVSAFIVQEQNLSQIPGSPFGTEADISEKLRDRKWIRLSHHVHTIIEDWQYDDDTHFKLCTECEMHVMQEAHTFVSHVCFCGKISPHDFTSEYRDNGEGTHVGKCTGCDKWSAPVAHTYVKHLCVCGNEDVLHLGKYVERRWDSTKKQVVSTEVDIPATVRLITDRTHILSRGWYVVADDTVIRDRIITGGTVKEPTNIILLDGCTLTAMKGIDIYDSRALNVYGQSGDTGTIAAAAKNYDAAIGGKNDAAAGCFTMYGGTVIATGDSFAAAIGNGDQALYSDRFSFTMYGGSVTAIGGENGSAIGCGRKCDGAGTVIIYGGEVTADGGSAVAGIGGGPNSSGSQVTINGGKVTVTGGNIAFGQIHDDGSVSGTLTLGEGVTFGAGDGAESVRVSGNRDNVSEALGMKYFVSPYGTDPDGNPEKFSVTFDMNGHGTQEPTQTVPKGGTVIRPADPEADGWEFIGWYPDGTASDAPYDFTLPVESDLTLRAEWKLSPVSYVMIRGADQTVLKNADRAVFASNADFSKFRRVKVDGSEVAADCYTAESGSTVITFKRRFIGKLKVGTHSIEIVSSDGSARSGFTVADLPPKTGDPAEPFLWLGMCVLAILGVLLLRGRACRN